MIERSGENISTRTRIPKKSGCKINFKKIYTNESYPSKTGSFYDFGRVDGLNPQIFVSQVYSCTGTIIKRKMYLSEIKIFQVHYVSQT
jgi:hypothetical protein